MMLSLLLLLLLLEFAIIDCLRCNMRMLSCNNVKNDLKKVMLGLVISSSLISTPQSLIAAGLPDFDNETEVKAISTVTTTSTNAVKVITATVKSDKKSSSIISDNDDDISYSNSLAKEQKKQESRKKSKTERSKDLCESLGRGC